MKSNKWSLSQSARFSICKRRGASLLLFPAAYTSVQNLVTLVMLDGSAWLAYRFVVFFSTLEIASLSLFPPFLTCLILFDVPSTSNNKVGKPTWHIVHVHIRNHLVRTNNCTDIRRKQHVRSKCLFYNCKDIIISAWIFTVLVSRKWSVLMAEGKSFMTTLAGGFLVINYHEAGRKDFKK